MATGRRISRVSELIKREISQMLLFGIKDERIGGGMVSVTDVDVSGDLQHAKVFVSIYGTDEARAGTMEGLQSACGYIRGQLGKRVNLRRTPELSFEEDRSLERGMRVINLIEQLAQDRPAEEPEAVDDEAAAEPSEAKELEV
jgi:ribosome-binding factor A